MDILFWDTFCKIGISKDRLCLINTLLVDLAGHRGTPLETIRLTLTLKEELRCYRVDTNWLVVDWKISYWLSCNITLWIVDKAPNGPRNSRSKGWSDCYQGVLCLIPTRLDSKYCASVHHWKRDAKGKTKAYRGHGRGCHPEWTQAGSQEWIWVFERSKKKICKIFWYST